MHFSAQKNVSHSDLLGFRPNLGVRRALKDAAKSAENGSTKGCGMQ
jgi:hypothetical protein